MFKSFAYAFVLFLAVVAVTVACTRDIRVEKPGLRNMKSSAPAKPDTPNR